MIKPKKLKEGSRVAIVQPSAGLATLFPEVYNSGLLALKNLGLEVVEFPTSKMSVDEVKKNPELRAKDINDAFADESISAIIASIGGDDSVRILPFLNPKIIKNNPKILMGYSDTTTLTSYVNQLGIVTLNGPTILAGFSQWEAMPEKWQDHIKKVFFEGSAEYSPFNNYSEGYPDWGNKENVGKVKPLKKAGGWEWLQGVSAVGELFGGCIEVFEFFKSTDFWPSENFWDNKILFFETSEDVPSPEAVSWMLRNYGMQGIFDRVNGIIFGRARGYTEEMNEELYKLIVSVVAEEFGRKDLPIMANFDFGHTDPQFIMPLGIKVEMKNNSFRLLEKILD